MKRKKKIVIGIIIVLILLASISISAGVYYNYLSKPKYVFTVLIDHISNYFQTYTESIGPYEASDNVSFKGTLSFDLNSEDLMNKSKTDPEALKSYHFIQNLNKMNTNYVFQQNKDSQKLYFSILGKIGEENVLEYRYLIDNATEYYSIPSILKDYVNNGNSNYFEVLGGENTTKDNQEYLYQFFIESLKSNISDSSIQISQDIYNEKKVKKATYRITDSVLKEIIGNILKDFQDDSKASQILSIYDSDFSKRKISEDTAFLGPDESYTLNVYSSGIWNTIVKWEIIYLNDNQRNVFSYEIEGDKGNAYYIENEKVIYQISFLSKKDSMEIHIHDSSLKSLGEIRFEKLKDGINITYAYDNGENKYDFLYSSTYQKVKKDSYENEKKISFKILDHKVSLLNGSITLQTSASNKARIEEEIDPVVLSSTLEEEVQKKIADYPTHVFERLVK